ncbi:Chromo (CHRromatin Organization MOdifier) domain [Carpediemonas membranifera]|uniref:Chromo (CHRromatin Organization MOdifier) domain n=1 Tax=Carpediemonas membranifera TaxID=201153 RepID=A0A8J6E835_9EUKA|nr:Chromo (CHRromatin Organization MOdifier) domain [Carpediemonas membranifera]|eukprot:KAG9391375.1 Chromo (CHRromatin Organization MOdifier) domain [Carpediemonas membranifera]
MNVKVNQEVNKLTSSALSPAAIKEWRLDAKIFLASNEGFPVALLLAQDLQDLVKEALGADDIEKITLEEIITTLQREVIPDSLLELRAKIEGVTCGISTTQKGRTAAIREYISDITQWTDLAPQVAKYENLPDFAFLFNKVKEDVAVIVKQDDGESKAEIQERERDASRDEIAEARAKTFLQKKARQILVAKLRPPAFKRKVETMLTTLPKASFSDTVKVIRAMAKHDEALSSAPDVPEKPVEKEGNKSAPSSGQSFGQNSSGSTSSAGKARTPKACYICGEVGHFADSCPKRRTRENGGLRQNPPKRTPMEANAVDENEEALATEAVINSSTYMALIDSGAGPSIITSRTSHILRERQPGLVEKSCPPRFIRTASNALVKVTTTLTVEVTLPHVGEREVRFEQTFLVLPSSREKILLGCSTLRSLGLLTPEGLHIVFKPEEKDETEDFPFANDYLEANTTEEVEEGVSTIHIPESEISEDLRALCAAYEDVFDPHLPKNGARTDQCRSEGRRPIPVTVR